jgi:hypothetical protein
MIGLVLALAACSPAPPAVQQNASAQQTPTPEKKKMIQFNNTGY